MATRTKLSPEEEARFQKWFANWNDHTGRNEDPDSPHVKYDYRGAWKAGAIPDIELEDNKRVHWPSEFKDDDHPNRYVTNAKDNPDTVVGGGMLDSKYGKPVSKNRQPKILVDKIRRRAAGEDE